MSNTKWIIGADMTKRPRGEKPDDTIKFLEHLLREKDKRIEDLVTRAESSAAEARELRSKNNSLQNKLGPLEQELSIASQNYNLLSGYQQRVREEDNLRVTIATRTPGEFKLTDGKWEWAPF